MSAGAKRHSRAPARGLVAIGDSITHGSGEAMLGLRMQSWALWLAEALELPFTGLAVNGARARDALEVQLPRLAGPYDLGCVYLGVNDVRSPDWQPEDYGESLQAVVAALAAEAHMLVLVMLPGAIGRPPAPSAAISSANELIESVARSHDALLVKPGAPAPGLVLPDAVHLTARGQAQLAWLAARELERAGLAVADDALREALAPLSRQARLRYALGQGGAARLRDWRRRASEHAVRGGAGARA